MPALLIDDVLGLLSGPGPAGLFSDFDGTLSPIVPDPAAARPLPGAAEALHRLATRLAEVAVVSGRPAGFLAGHFAPIEGERLELFGLHGLERWGPGGVEPVEAARPFVEVVAGVRARALEAGIPGLVVEDKVLSLTLHWRRARDPEGTGAAASALALELAAGAGLEVRPGKASVELVPPLGIDKGTVVRERGRRLAAVVFLGDDRGDLRAFDALDELERAGAGVARVGVAGAEAPPELLERADLVLSGPHESLALLEALAARLA